MGRMMKKDRHLTNQNYLFFSNPVHPVILKKINNRACV